MHLTIRWKFILSIGLTLLATYLALLSWDYKWQRETATLQAQDLATERAQSLATSLNERLAPGEHQANLLAAAIEAVIQKSPPADEASARMLIADAISKIQPTVSMTAWVEIPEKGPGSPPVVVSYSSASEFFGPRRGGGTFRPGSRGGGRRGELGGPPDVPGRGGRRGGEPGPPSDAPERGGRVDVVHASLQNAWKSRFSDIDLPTEGQWLGLRVPRQAASIRTSTRLEQASELMLQLFPEFGMIPGPQSIYAIPISGSDTIKGMVFASLPVSDLPQFRVREPIGRGGGPPPTTASSTQSSVLDELAFTIIGPAGRAIWPPAEPERRGAASQSPPPPPASQPSILEAALASGGETLAEQIRTALAGKTTVVRVHDLPELVPGFDPGENYWVALAPVATTGWVVTSAIPESQFLTRIVDRLYQRGEFLLAGLAVLLAIITFISIRISRPIEKMAAAVNQLAAGNLDAQVKDVASGDELGQLAGAFNTMTRQLRQHVAALTEQTKARESVESEMRIARQIQADLLPRKFPPFPDRKEFELHAVNVPAKRVAGDFYDFFFTPNGLLTIAVADVSGKGMPAALLMAVTRTMIRNLANEGLSPQQIAERANQMLLADLSDSMFVTLFLCQYDPGSGRIVYVNAGHPRPYVFADHGIPKQFGEVTGALLGVHTAGADWAYEQREEALQPGQTLLIYTDGVTEARSPQGIMLRDSGLEQLISRFGSMSVEAICSGLVDELNKYQSGQPADDVTLVALRRKN